MSRRGVLGRLALAAVSILLTLLLAEGALRLAGFGGAGRGSPWFAGGSHPRYLFRPDPATGYSLRPGFVGRDVAASGEFEVPVAIDARGLRQHRRIAPAGGGPVLVVGDSMTYGEGVPVDEAFPAVLEARLGRTGGSRVINGGVPGYDSRQMVARGRRLVGRFDPPLVLVVFEASWDLDRCSHPFVYRDGYIVAWGWRHRLELVGGNLYSWEVHSPLLGPWIARLEGHSRLARLALPAAVRLARRLAGRGGGGAAPLPPPADWAPCEDALAGFSADLRRGGRDLLVVLADSPKARDREATARLAARLAGRRVPVLRLDDLLPADRVEARRFPRDRHWNAAGHRAVGEALARALAPRLSAAGG